MKATAFVDLSRVHRTAGNNKVRIADAGDIMARKFQGRSHNGGIMAKAFNTAFANKLQIQRKG